MNKGQLVEKIAEKAKTTKVDAEKILDATLELIRSSVKKGDEVKLVGFGTFSKAKRKARKGMNTKTGEEIKIPTMWVPKFKPGTDFRNILKK
ncbi:MAG: HU family DNA-binding protein [Bdellovibrionales bacterium]|nr:HU family DNA-binding protein [Bdellovibrionales bacterium]